MKHDMMTALDAAKARKEAIEVELTVMWNRERLFTSDRALARYRQLEADLRAVEEEIGVLEVMLNMDTLEDA